MKRKISGVLSLLIVVSMILVGCSSSSGTKSSGSSDASSSNGAKRISSSVTESSSASKSTSNNQAKANSMPQTSKQSAMDVSSKTTSSQAIHSSRMVIYHADMSVTVPKLKSFLQTIETQAKQYHGYVLNLNQNKTNDHLNASLTCRIPQQDFYHFLNFVEKESGKVMHKQINGQDVTKQYVDLSARLKAKELVKDRLTSYLNKAKTTKDLLAISNQLGSVQESIEQIQGQMHYYKNQSDLSTVSIQVTEQTKPKIHTKNLNTWQKSVNLFKSSINGLVTFFSGLVVILVGVSPIIILLLIVLAIGYYIYKQRKKKG